MEPRVIVEKEEKKISKVCRFGSKLVLYYIYELNLISNLVGKLGARVQHALWNSVLKDGLWSGMLYVSAGARHPRRAKDGLSGTRLEIVRQCLMQILNSISDVSWTLSAMINCGVMFSVVVSIIVDSFIPKNFKLILSLTVTKPVIPHIPCLGSLLMNVVIYEASSSGIICLNGRRRLRMIETLKKMSNWNSHTSIVVHTSHLCFRRRRHNMT